MRDYLVFFSLLCCGLHNLAVAWDSGESYIEKIAAQKSELSFIDELPNNITSLTCNALTIPQQLNIVPFSQEVVTAAKTTGSSGSVLSAVAGSGISAAQVSRTMSVAKVLTCSNYSVYEGEALEWQDSPTQLSLGRGLLRYPFGAVVGNTAIIVVVETILAGLAKWKGAETVRFPGAVILPTLLLSTQTTTAAATLMRYGNTTYKVVGWGTIAVQVIGGGVIAWLLWPANFDAKFDTESRKWLDTTNSGFAKRYSLLFQDFREGRHGFILVELSMNLASGLLAAYVEEQPDCNQLAWIATSVYGGYALVTIIMMPYVDTVDKIYFTLVPIAQTVPLVIYANSDPLAEEPTTAQNVAGTIPVVLYWVTLLRSVYDVAMLAKAAYKFYHRVHKTFSADMLGDDESGVPMLPQANPLDANGGT